jgi:NifU-like protein
MTLEEAAKISNQDIVDYLGELPEAKMHCSVMGSEALEAAIINYRTGGTAPPHTEERIICKCFGVTQETIERTIAEHNLTTVEEVTNYTKAGGACGTCQPDIEELLSAHSENREPSSPDESTAKKRLTNIEKIKLIQETIEREIRPELRKDGGDIELVDVVGNEVLVSMRGNCAGCQVAEFTLSKVVEQKLREFVSPELVVVEEK